MTSLHAKDSDIPEIQSEFGESKPVSLLGEWEYRKGYQDEWQNDHESGEWLPLITPSNFSDCPDLDHYNGRITLRKQLPDNIAPQHLALNCGQISNVAKIYLNETFIGEVGSNDSALSITWGRKVIDIPNDAFYSKSDNFIYIVMETGTSGRKAGILGPAIQIGPAATLYSRYYVVWVISFIISGLYLAIGIFYLIIGLYRKEERHYIYFGLFSIFAFLFFIANSEVIAYLNVQNHKTLVYLLYFLDQGSIRIMIPLFVLCFSNLFDGQDSRIGKALIVYACVHIFADIAGFALVRNLVIQYSMSITYIPLAISIVYTFRQTIIQIRISNREAWFLAGGILMVAVGVVHDILVIEALIFGYMIFPYLFFSFSAGLAAILLNRFLILQKEVEDFNSQLNEKVSTRSSELLLGSIMTDISAGDSSLYINSNSPDLTKDITILTRIDDFIEIALVRVIALSEAEGGIICDEENSIRSFCRMSADDLTDRKIYEKLHEFPMALADNLQWRCVLLEPQKLNQTVEKFLERVAEVIGTATGFRHGDSGSELAVTAERKVKRAIAYMDEYFSEGLTRYQVAELVDLNPDYFGRLLKKKTGRNFNDFINGYKIKEAARLLEESEMNIVDIAFEAGFESLSTFNRAFKKEKELTPSQYRLKTRNQ
ncbi:MULTISPECIES: helix-turn-helix domain-containing protein [unclassified Oceanispirochaeta]|uniref:helix-turn-helix domain-containing protein n=1 Tax=unclassified Oceanispirochaeta TaxID=2635722 RepID=UPI001313E369|nr:MULTISPECIES: helix-turn-helix domain-containing protein [unclassified Oceanispirochaeta]MBF9018702.1 helix-turn-helix domain-containing protein [Oceanispirochaeta sp. M2]NPD75123.1 helix-turn-helix domain-containing protein [Oceanispirochaeta sp. M1]